MFVECLFLALGWRGSDFTRGHQIANVFLEELVVVIELVMFFSDGLDAVEDGQERVLQGLCVSVEKGAVSDWRVSKWQRVSFTS